MIEFVPVIGDVNMSWEVPQPATGDFASLLVDVMEELCFAAAVLTTAERPTYEVDEEDDDPEPNPNMAPGLYFFIADGLGYYSGAEFYRPCATVDEAKTYLSELTLDLFKANAKVIDDPRYPLADQDWIIKLGWKPVDL